MPTEEGIVKEIKRKKAMVLVTKTSACDHCGSRGSCHIMSDREMFVEVANDLNAKVGDLVRLQVPSGSLLKLSLLVYFLPVVLLIIGAYVGGAWAESLDLQPTLASIIGAGLAMGVAFYVLRWFDRGEQAKGDYQPRMTRILFSESSSPQPGDSK
jgi:sigma-E factor negative regulatory protein RseC